MNTDETMPCCSNKSNRNLQMAAAVPIILYMPRKDKSLIKTTEWKKKPQEGTILD